MTRRLLNLVTALSLLVCVAVVALWPLGYWRSDLFSYGRDGGRVAFWLCSGRGGLGFQVITGPPGSLGVGGAYWFRQPPRYGGTYWPSMAGGGLGFYGTTTKDPSGLRCTGACLPTPVVFLVTATVTWLCVGRCRRREAPGLCPRCGYDLRATPDRCPECGPHEEAA